MLTTILTLSNNMCINSGLWIYFHVTLTLNILWCASHKINHPDLNCQNRGMCFEIKHVLRCWMATVIHNVAQMKHRTSVFTQEQLQWLTIWKALTWSSSNQTPRWYSRLSCATYCTVWLDVTCPCPFLCVFLCACVYAERKKNQKYTSSFDIRTQEEMTLWMETKRTYQREK